MSASAQPSHTYVVEHLDPELGDWSALEYGSIARESHRANARFLLTSVPEALQLPADLAATDGLGVEHRSVEDIFASKKDRVCLLDPAAKTELSPQDGDAFDVFLFGGILGDDPPRDRTAELRQKGFANRRLGPVQMTTDTAVRVTRMVVQDKSTTSSLTTPSTLDRLLISPQHSLVPLEQVPYVDYPELRINEHESTEMPFRYVKDDQGKPIMPEGMVELIKQDADKSVNDLL